jgi:hypothetical protein
LDAGACERELADLKRASHRGHGGHRGGIRLGIRFFWTPGLMSENSRI